MKKDPKNNASQAEGIGGLAILACFLICLLGLIFACASLYEKVDLTASGICLIGPAIAMGLIAASFVRR